MSIIYLDCNATAPLAPPVREVVLRYLDTEYGNAGSRTHDYGSRAKAAVREARESVAQTLDAAPDEVVFTSGATESNNLAILGLAAGPAGDDRRHIVTTAIEHKAVLEPLAELEKRGFEVTYVRPERGGYVDADAVGDACRVDTLLVCVMHVNNETGVQQPLSRIAERLEDKEAYLLVDAAQGFGKVTAELRNPRIDLVTLSAHKCYGPKGVGALVARKRGYRRPPLRPLVFGGGQERGLRPGTLPVHLIAGLGAAAQLAERHSNEWAAKNIQLKNRLLDALCPLEVKLHGNPELTLPHVLNFSVPGVDAEAAVVALKHIAAISNGSACTSNSYEPSHVLRAMGVGEDEIAGALRLSWCHMTPEFDPEDVVGPLAKLRG